jgi:probable HAF family extracellular repeat protein
MWFHNFFKSLTSISTRRRSTRRRPSASRLCLEPLEDRCLLAYSVIDLGSLGDGPSQASDINTSGQVVGWSQPSDGIVHGFLWQNGVMTDLGTLGGLSGYSRALGINDVGQIVGSSTAFDGLSHAFLLTPEDTDGNGAPDRWFRDSNSDRKNDLMLDLGPNSYADDVNNAGQVVGASITGGVPRASLWENGVMTDLGTLGGSTSSAGAINDAGQVTGMSDTSSGTRSAFLWQGGVMHDIGAGASDINQSGQVAGASGYSATLWTPTTPNGTTGMFQSLGGLPPDLVGPEYQYQGASSGASGVNDLGSAVGYTVTSYWYFDTEGTMYYVETSRAFVWADGVMEELPGLQNPAAINNAGQIVGNGPYSYLGESAYRAYLLTPESATTPS